MASGLRFSQKRNFSAEVQKKLNKLIIERRRLNPNALQQPNQDENQDENQSQDENEDQSQDEREDQDQEMRLATIDSSSLFQE